MCFLKISPIINSIYSGQLLSYRVANILVYHTPDHITSNMYRSPINVYFDTGVFSLFNLFVVKLLSARRTCQYVSFDIDVYGYLFLCISNR
jgi:hypothetical protein